MTDRTTKTARSNNPQQVNKIGPSALKPSRRLLKPSCRPPKRRLPNSNRPNNNRRNSSRNPGAGGGPATLST